MSEQTQHLETIGHACATLQAPYGTSGECMEAVAHNPQWSSMAWHTTPRPTWSGPPSDCGTGQGRRVDDRPRTGPRAIAPPKGVIGKSFSRRETPSISGVFA